jgi:hypothetical protein
MGIVQSKRKTKITTEIKAKKQNKASPESKIDMILTTPLIPVAARAQAEDILPFSHPTLPPMARGRFSFSLSSQRHRILIQCCPTPHTGSITPMIESPITILNPTLRIIRIDLPELDLGQDNPRQAIKDLFHPITGQSTNLNRNGYVRHRSPL